MDSPWDKIFKKPDKIYSEVQKELPKIVKLFKKRNVKKVLDLGCGWGRNLIFLAKHGFKTYGIDFSKEGIKIAKKWLRKKNLRANLKIGSIFKKLPYKDNFFDAIISISALQHSRIKNIRYAIKEIERILKPNGLIFINFPRRKFQRSEIKYKIIEPRTYILLEGDKKGVVHYFFNKKILREEFKNFKICDIWIDSWGYNALLAEKKF